MLNPETPIGVDGTNAARRWSRRRILLALVVVLAVGVVLGLWVRSSLRSQQAAVEDDESLDPVVEVVNPGYVGAKVCGECHAKRFAEFQTTRHFLACAPATAIRAPGFAPGRGFHPSRDPNLHFEMTRSGDDFHVATVQRTSQGRETRSYDLALVYGAGGIGDEMYFAWQGDRLYNLPVGWLYPFGRWGHTVDTAQPREANPNCLECHNTWAAHIPGTPNQYRREDMLLGVTCERCHGPGREHAAHHRQKPHDAAHAIVHPGHLSRERLMEVCTQCHGNTKRRGPVFSYRPGEPLEASYRTVQTRYPEDDQVANQVQYLRRSKCFQKSKMTCITCHNPHRPQQPAVVGAACLKCHPPDDCKDRSRQPAAVRSNCTGCHMPPRIWMNVRFHTTDDQYVPVSSRADHRIAVHPEANHAVLLAWLRTQTDAGSRAEADRLAGRLAKHWLDEADQRRRAARLLATIGALREALKVAPTPATRKLLGEAIARQSEFDRLVLATNGPEQRQPGETLQLMKKILQIKPNHAPALGEMGMMYALMGNSFAAQTHLQAAAQADPEDTFCLTALAQLAGSQGRWAEAVALYAKADAIEPYDASIHHAWGSALLKLERWADAAEHFRIVLKIDPRHAGGSDGSSESLRRQGRVEEAILYARRAVRWSGRQNAQMLLTLADAYTAAERPTDARKTLDQAVTVAEENNLTLLPAIRARLRTLQDGRK